jgi:hypothetical protein
MEMDNAIFVKNVRMQGLRRAKTAVYSDVNEDFGEEYNAADGHFSQKL